MRFLITGATGLIGRNLIRQILRDGNEAVALSRRPQKFTLLPAEQVFFWQHTLELSRQSLKDVDVIVNLAGEGIADHRWTKERKRALEESRILGTRNLVEAISKLDPQDRPKVLISASAIGYYGTHRDEPLDEESPAGVGFLAELCRHWEETALRARTIGLRVVLLRTSMVLSNDGGALKKIPPVVIGRGLDWVSWIHLDDMIRFILFAAQNQNISGPYNLASPNAVQNREFIRALAKAKKIPIHLAVPRILPRLALGEMSQAILSSLRVVPKRALAAGFQFLYPQLELALADLF